MKQLNKYFSLQFVTFNLIIEGVLVSTTIVLLSESLLYSLYVFLALVRASQDQVVHWDTNIIIKFYVISYFNWWIVLNKCIVYRFSKKKKKIIVYKSLYNILQKKLNTEKNQRPIELLWTIIEDNICPHQKMLSTFQNTRDSR